MAGVTETGFEAETTDTLKTAIENELKLAFGNSFNVRPTSVAGVLVGIMSRKLADLWEAAESIWGSQYPETAFGSSLDQLGLLTGTTRLQATHSEVTLALTGTPGTVIPTGSRVRNSDTGTFWRLKTSNGNITIPSTSAATGTFESEDFGEVLGVAGSLDTIDTVISGWTAVNNTADATLGRDQETDADFRLRRSELITSQGKGTLDAIRSDVLACTGIVGATVNENVTLVTDANGLPGKSFEVIVRQGTAASADIWQAIWDSKPAGISAYGTTTGPALDALSGTRYVAYTPVTEVSMYVAVSAITTGGTFTGLTASLVNDIKLAITAYEETLESGNDVVRKALEREVLEVSGVFDISGDLRVDRFASPTATSNTAIGFREHANFDTSRIDVTLL